MGKDLAVAVQSVHCAAYRPIDDHGKSVLSLNSRIIRSLRMNVVSVLQYSISYVTVT